MDAVNFLNIEYIVLRIGAVLSNIFGPILGINAEDQGGVGSNASSQLISAEAWFILGQFALAGMALAFILLVLSVYIRIKLELFEHEEFHKRDARYHRHAAHPVLASIEAHAPEEKNKRWQDIVRLSSSESESDWRRAVLEADILLGELLESQGYRGHSIGDKLKDANPLQFTTLDSAWKAHKVRNDIAHGGEGFHLSERDTKSAIDSYRRVFEEFDFI
jgi:hypothetical protein